MKILFSLIASAFNDGKCLLTTFLTFLICFRGLNVYEYCFTVNENVFFPPPKVKSGVIRLVRNEKEQIGCSEEAFFKVVKTAFNQRRKMLRNALKTNFSFTNPEDELLNKRAEQLSVEDFVRLVQMLGPIQ